MKCLQIDNKSQFSIKNSQSMTKMNHFPRRKNKLKLLPLRKDNPSPNHKTLTIFANSAASTIRSYLTKTTAIFTYSASAQCSSSVSASKQSKSLPSPTICFQNVKTANTTKDVQGANKPFIKGTTGLMQRPRNVTQPSRLLWPIDAHCVTRIHSTGLKDGGNIWL
jgi:hypothetical protein